MDHAPPIDENALSAGEDRAPAAAAPADDLSWAVVKMRAGAQIVVNQPLIAAYQTASSPHTIRALKSDLEAFDLWCRRHNRIALPAVPETVADYLDARAGQGSKPASLGRYKASIAKIHQLLELKDPTVTSLVKLRLQAIRRRLGTAQTQARPLRFKGPVRDVERDAPRGLNVRALLESCADELPGLPDRALLSVKIGGTHVTWPPDPGSNTERRLIYLGGRSQVARFGYREFIKDIARPAVSEDLTVTLYNLRSVVTVKDQHIRITRADGEGITFEIPP